MWGEGMGRGGRRRLRYGCVDGGGGGGGTLRAGEGWGEVLGG